MKISLSKRKIACWVAIAAVATIVVFQLPSPHKMYLSQLEDKANSGDLHAMLDLAQINSNGPRTAEELQNAFYWTSRAAATGNADAQFRLGDLFEKGVGTEINLAQAAANYSAAADQGHAPALRKLGLLYLKGNGVEKNSEKGYSYIEKAAEENDSVAQYLMGNQTSKRGNQSVDPTIPFGWYLRAAKQGYPWAQVKVAEYYSSGVAVPKSFEEEIRWLSLAANAGLKEAQHNLAERLRVQGDISGARKWHLKAALSGFNPSQKALGIMLSGGNAIRADLLEGYAWLNVAGVSDENARQQRDLLEERMSAEERINAQQRSQQILGVISEQN
jgi:uncharacterized protein